MLTVPVEALIGNAVAVVSGVGDAGTQRSQALHRKIRRLPFWVRQVEIALMLSRLISR